MHFWSWVLVLLAFCIEGCAHRNFSSEKAFDTEFVSSSKLVDGELVPWIAHSGHGRFTNYVAMNLPAEPAIKLFHDLQKTRNEKIKSRGESHITVITPPEFDDILSKHLNIQEINSIVAKSIQRARAEPLCVGRGVVQQGNKSLSTYFVVVKSSDLVALRAEIARAFLAKGGQAGEFRPGAFYPHITIGFTDRDLHEADGVIKNTDSCFAGIKIQ